MCEPFEQLKRNFHAGAALAVASSFLAVVFSTAAQTVPPAPETPAAKAPAFDVVSIRPHKDKGNNSHWGAPTPTGYEAYTTARYLS